MGKEKESLVTNCCCNLFPDDRQRLSCLFTISITTTIIYRDQWRFLSTIILHFGEFLDYLWLDQ